MTECNLEMFELLELYLKIGLIEVLFCFRAFCMYKIATVTKEDGATVTENQKLETNWDIAEAVAGYE